MTDTEQLTWLLEGRTLGTEGVNCKISAPNFSSVSFFDKFRQAGKLDQNGIVLLSGYDLRCACFHLTDLSHVDFGQADLRGARLIGTRHYETSFIQADLTDAVFGVGNLGGANLSCATLRDTDLTQVNLTGADLGGRSFGKPSYTQILGTWRSQRLMPKPEVQSKKLKMWRLD